MDNAVVSQKIFQKGFLKMIRNSFKKALCLFCTVAMIASTLVVMSVSTLAATISIDENVFNNLESYNVWSTGLEKQPG